jgi:glycosyltransferase involved in cell wall biosynthesis
MRIALAHSHVETFGGGERAVLGLAQGLAGRHQVRLLLGRYAPERTYPELAGFPRQRLGRGDWPARRVPDDAVVANSFGSNLLALRNPGRVIYWVHSLRSVFLVADTQTAGLRLRRALDRVAVARSARLVANSHFTARRLRAEYGREPDAMVYPGVDSERYRPHPGAAAYAISVGRLAREKGLDRLLRAWRELPEVPLLLVGGGDDAYVGELRSMAPSNVSFAGPCAPAELAELYVDAALAVFTPYAEEFGIAPLEAMATARPVVAWHEGGLTETVVDGETGYLVDDEAALRQRVRLLFRNGALRQRLGEQGRARAESFSWARAVAHFERLCWELTSGRPARARPA